MATTSFTLRKVGAERGSYVQKVGTDSAIRADSVTPAITTPALEATSIDTGTFSANVIDRDSVLLSWELSFSLETVAGVDGYAPKELAIISSSTGEPITYQDGDVVATITDNDTFDFTDISRVSPGRWVYYSLFVKYSDFGNPEVIWYERVATLYVQIPKPYNSINNLWSKIPEYYRLLDADVTGNPLYNFIELFGWELDRTRTLIDTVALSNDPEIAVTPALRELAYETGLEFDIDVLGTSKARSLLENIGYLRRRKGTTESVAAYLSAITGSQVSYVTTGTGASATHTFKVHNQRINFASDPTFYDATYTKTTGLNGTNRTGLTSTATWGVYSYGATTTTSASAVTTGNELTVKNVGTGTIQVLVYQRKPFPYYQSAYLYAGFEPTLSVGASFNNFHVSTDTKRLSWESLVTSGSVPPALYLDTWNTSASQLAPDNTHPLQARYELAPNSSLTTTVSVVPVLHFSLAAGASVKISKMLVEPYSIGEYFDGNSREGGLIPGLTGVGTGSSDYRWASSPKSSFSYYLLDYKRVYEISQDIIRNYIVPVTVKDRVYVTFDYYYGA